MKPRTVSYHEDLIRSLRNPETASLYLNEALEEGDKDFFLQALRHVLEAQGGMTRLARDTKLNRVSIYKMLGSKGNPAFDSILRLLKAAGVRFTVTPNAAHRKAA